MGMAGIDRAGRGEQECSGMNDVGKRAGSLMQQFRRLLKVKGAIIGNRTVSTGAHMGRSTNQQVVSARAMICAEAGGPGAR